MESDVTPYESSADGSRAAQRAADSVESAPIDPHLQRVMDVWPKLPEHIKAAIQALVSSAMEVRR